MSGEGVLAVPDARVIRDELQRLVLADLLGPLGGPDEEFPTREDPLDRYILGRLAPNGITVDPETQDDLSDAAAPDLLEGDAEPSAPNVPSLAPSALGFTACVAGDVTALRVTAAWGRYEPTTSEHEAHAGRRVWRRHRHGGSVTMPLVEGTLRTTAVDQAQPDVVIRGRARRLDGRWLVSLFLENRQPDPRKRDAKPWIFQVELSATGTVERPVFVPRPEQISGGDASDQVERQRLAMAYRFHPEFAVGHGTAVRVDASPTDPRQAHTVHTSTVPDHEVPFTDVPNPKDDPDLPELADVVLDMKRLAELAEDGPVEALTTALRPLVDGYRAWIARNEATATDPSRQLDGYRAQVRQALRDASVAADRIEAGIELLTAAGRGVRIDLVLESSSVDGGALRGATGASAAFARLRDRATFWHWPASRRSAAGNSTAAMHAKIIAADRRAALITSANLTDRALSSNLEVGVVLRDPEPVHRLVAHFSALMDAQDGPLQRLN